MKTVIVWVLLLLEIVSGLYIRKTQNSFQAQTKLNQTNLVEREKDKDTEKLDVYKLEEDKNTIKLEYPKPEKPVLREIIYYHVIETPYDNQGLKESEERKGPDFDQTRRPFTNSHGFQFLPEVLEKDGDSKNKIVDRENKTEEDLVDDGKAEEDLVDDEENDKLRSKDSLLNSEDSISSSSSYEESEEIEEVAALQKQIKEDSEEAVTTEIIEVYDDEEEEKNPVQITEEAKTLDRDEKSQEQDDEELTDNIEISTTKGHTQENNVIKNKVANEEGAEIEGKIEKKENTGTKAKIDDVVEEKKNARNLLFSQTKNKYQTRKNQNSPQSPHKSKREVSFGGLPPAPTLQPLNLAMLPDYIKELITTPKPDAVPSEHNFAPFKENDFKEELEDKIQDLISSFQPKDNDNDDYDGNDDDVNSDNEESDEEDDSDDNNVDENDSEDYDEDDDDRTYSLPPRTYGLNLTMGRGYVWNDLLSDRGMPGISFDVGDSKDSEQQPEMPKESLENQENTNRPEADNPTTPSPEPIILHPTETKPIHFESPNKLENTKETNTHDDLEDIPIQITQKPKSFLKTSSENHKHNIKDDNNEDFYTKTTIVANDKKRKHHSNGKDTKENNNKLHSSNKNEAPDFIKELMNNEQFWNWLGDWTATYMELLMKHIKNMVHNEVGRQMKKYKNESKTEHKENQQKEIQTVSTKKEQENEKSSEHKENQHKENETVSPKKEQENEKSFNKDQNNELKPDIHEKKVIIDGKEIFITHTTNFEQPNEDLNKKETPTELEQEKNNTNLLKHKKEKEENKKSEAPNKENRKKTPVSVKANNIFGNSPNSDVTNIFIFYPPNNDTLNNLPLKTKSQNAFIFPSEVTFDQRHPEYKDNKETVITEKPAQNHEISKETKVDDKIINNKTKIDQESQTTHKSDSEINSSKSNSEIPKEEKNIHMDKNTKENEALPTEKSDSLQTSEATTVSSKDVNESTDEAEYKKSETNHSDDDHNTITTVSDTHEPKPELNETKDNHVKKTESIDNKEVKEEDKDSIINDSIKDKDNSQHQNQNNNAEVTEKPEHNETKDNLVKKTESVEKKEVKKEEKDLINNESVKNKDNNQQQNQNNNAKMTEKPEENETNENIDKKSESLDDKDIKEEGKDKDLTTNDSIKDKKEDSVIDKVVLQT